MNLLSRFWPQEYNWIELFAGVGNLTKAMKQATPKYKCARFDILDNQNPPPDRKSNFMDLTHASGFAFLDSSTALFLFGLVNCLGAFIFGSSKPQNIFRGQPLGDLRLILLCILRGVPNDMAVHIGLKCSSLCKMNQGTSMRSACASIGYVVYKSVFEANVLLERTLLGLLVAFSRLD